MSWTRGRVRAPGGRNTRARVLLAYPLCMCEGCPACEAVAYTMAGGARACVRDSTEDDHVVPVAEGGSEAWHNHQGLCRGCHAVKSKAEAKRGQQRRAQAAVFDEGTHPGLTPGGYTPSPRI